MKLSNMLVPFSLKYFSWIGIADDQSDDAEQHAVAEVVREVELGHTRQPADVGHQAADECADAQHEASPAS
jgi:hypothetical protein